MPLTISQTADQLHKALSDYIEATYHVSDTGLIAQRKRELQRLGVISQRPFLESTPKYKAGAKYDSLDLPAATLELFSSLSSGKDGEPALIHDPPYQHQAASLRGALVDGRSLVVMTGTGSGKTECFLLPILGRVAEQARNDADVFRESPAVRALVLYPMNALVNDQLGRLRLLFGDSRVSSTFESWSGRPVRFARYTSRTLYPGVRTEKKDQYRLRSIKDYYVRYSRRQQGRSHRSNVRLQTLLKS